MIQKSHIWNSFFKNFISGIKSLYICPEVPVDIIRVYFFLISDFLADSEKDHTFYNTALLKKPHSFYEPQLN